MKKIEKCKVVSFGVIPEEFLYSSPAFMSYTENNGFKYDIAYIGFGLTEVSALEDAVGQAKLDNWNIEDVYIDIEKERAMMKRVAIVSEREDEGYWVGFSIRQAIND